MAYGNGNKDTEKRMVTLGVGTLTAAKFSALSELRRRYIAIANEFMSAVFVSEPLNGIPDKKTLDHQLLALQKAASGLNKTYVEKARLAVRDHAIEVHKRYLKRLVGQLRHCDSKVDDPKSTRRYLMIPEELQDSVSEKELQDLARRSKDWASAIDMLKIVMVDEAFEGFSEGQILAIQAMHQRVQERYRKPLYGKDDGFTCQIHLDYRVMPNLKNDDVFSALNTASSYLLVDEDNKTYRYFLDVAHPTPRAGRVAIPLQLTKQHLKSLGIEGKAVTFKSLVLEITDSQVQVKAVVEKQPQPFAKTQEKANKSPKGLSDEQWVELAAALNACDHLIGRDYGYANTVALTMLKRHREITADDLKELMRIRGMSHDKAKEAMEAWFTKREGKDLQVVSQVCYSGQNFLQAIARHCEYIDRLSSQIDHTYNKIHALKANLAHYFDLADDEHLPRQGLKCSDEFVKKLHNKFFRLLDKVNHLKSIRRQRYKSIRGLKKSWFGFLANQEVKLAKQYNAALIREDLTVMAIEKEKPDYKGRRFNKMINNGSKGLYLRQAGGKLLWNGIPELAMPTPYTSQACALHSRLGDRQGESFRCPECQATRHSDANAALNIAGMLLTQPTALCDKRILSS